MDRTEFSREIFGNTFSPNNFFSAGNNTRQIAFLRSQLQKAMKSELTERQQEILSAFYFKGMTVTEISKDLGVNKSTVSRHLARSKEKLKGALRYGYIPMWEE